MKNKKNISFFILFLLYIFIFILTYDFFGENVFYASLPMILGASMLYGYIAGFVVIALNIPATLILFYVFGIPFYDSIKFVNPFIILLSCICVVIPGMIKLYLDKTESLKFRGYEKRIDELTTKAEDKSRQCDEAKVLADMYKGMLDETDKKDIQTGLLSRKAVSDYIIKEGCTKQYIIVKLKQIEKINREIGFIKGDEYIKNIAKELLLLNITAGRITGACFMLIADSDKTRSITDKLTAAHPDEFDIHINIIAGGETLEDILDKAVSI